MGKDKNKCKECGGSNFCEHGKEKYRCKECGGVSLCIHNIIRLQCFTCSTYPILSCVYLDLKHIQKKMH